MASKIIFLDRDGTINVDHGYVTKPENVELIEGAAEAIALLKSAGYKTVVVSNQSAIGRGFASHQDVEATNFEIERQLEDVYGGALLDLIVYSADHPDQATDRRKPGIGMLRDVSIHFDIDLENSWVIGDKISDIQFGLNAGIPKEQCLLVLTGAEKSAYSDTPSFTNILLAVKHILLQ